MLRAAAPAGGIEPLVNGHHFLRSFLENLFAGKVPSPDPAPSVVVLGLYRSGSSCVAGMLHCLGVHMGGVMHETSVDECPTGTFEALSLCKVCWKAYLQPSTERRMSDRVLVGRLSRWIRRHRREAARQGKVAGVKHPLLCAMVPELLATFPNLKIISIDRSVEESVRSLVAMGWWEATADECDRLQRYLWDQKQTGLAGTDHLVMDYKALLAEPKDHIDRIVAYLGIEPSAEQLAATLEFVDPQLKRF